MEPSASCPCFTRPLAYAHGVDESTAVLPDGWKDRLVKIENENTRGAVGWCLEVNDLAVSKLAAGRVKDQAFVECMLRHKLIDADIVRSRLVQTSRLTEEGKQLAIARLARWQQT